MPRVLRSDLNPSCWTTVDTTEDGDIAITHHEDVSEQLEWNTKLRNALGKGATRNKDEWRLRASIPLSIWQELMRQRVISPDGISILDEKALRRWLNDPDNRAFRVTEGKL